MWKLCGSSSVKCKSKSFFRFLSLILLLGMAFCPQAQSGQANVAYFAGGCFWCTEAVFRTSAGRDVGQSRATCRAPRPFRSRLIPLKPATTNCSIYSGEAHDPTQVDGQGADDTGKQYRSAIFYVNDQQRDAAQRLKPQVQKFYSKPIATEITRGGIISSGARKSSELLPEKPKQSVRPTNHRAEAQETRSEETLSAMTDH